MSNPNTQPLKVTLEFTYDADTFEGDPDDAYEIARLEKEILEQELTSEIELFIPSAKNYTIKVVPA